MNKTKRNTKQIKNIDNKIIWNQRRNQMKSINEKKINKFSIKHDVIIELSLTIYMGSKAKMVTLCIRKHYIYVIVFVCSFWAHWCEYKKPFGRINVGKNFKHSTIGIIIFSFRFSFFLFAMEIIRNCMRTRKQKNEKRKQKMEK